MTQSIVPAFSTGIVSDELSSSSEIPKIKYGVKECLNMIVSPLGGLKNRPGTEYIGEAAVPTLLSRMIPFEFNKEQAYVLEFAHNQMRVLKDKALVLMSIRNATYKWTLSGSGTSEYYLELAAGGDPGLADPTKVLENGVNMTEATLGSLSAGEWNYGDNDTLGYNTVYVRLSDSTDPDGKAADYVQTPFQVTSPYQGNEVADLDHTSSADVLYVTHGSHNPYKITRTADDAWTVTEMDDIDGPYKPRVAGDEDVSIQATYNTGKWDLKAKSAIFGDVEVGEPLRLGFPIPGDLTVIHWQWFLVDSVTDSSNITVVLQDSDTDLITYQQVENNVFKESTAGTWDDISDSGSTLSYDFTNQVAVLTDGAAGNAKMEQAVLTFANQKQWLVLSVFGVTGTSPTVTLKIGTASGLGDIYTSSPIVAAGDSTHSFIPTQETIYINFDTVGSTDADTVRIDEVSLYSQGDNPSDATKHTTTDWRLAAWNSTHGYPKKVFNKDQRLHFANNDAEPDTIWVTELGNFESHAFHTPSRATDALSFFPATQKINGIRWMAEYNGLKIGTADGFWNVFATSGGAITPTDVNVKIDNRFGSLDLPPIVAGNSILMTPRGFTAVTELTSSFETSGFVSRDITILASNLFENRRIIKWDYAQSPDSVIWCVLDDHSLLGITYIKEYDLWAWHRHETPSTIVDGQEASNALGNQGFMDVIVIPNSSDDNIDDVYFLVNRTRFVTGSAAQSKSSIYIETLNKRITSQTAAYGLSASGTPYDYRFLDSALTLDEPTSIEGATQANPVVVTDTAHGFSDGDLIRIQNVVGMVELNNNVYKVANKTADTYELNDTDDNDIDGTGFSLYRSGGESRKMVTTISNLDHLEGLSVMALADGAVLGPYTVSSGSITLIQAASFVHAGLSYTSEVETLDLEVVADTGSTQGRLKSLNKVNIIFKDTRGVDGIKMAASSNDTSGPDSDGFWSIKFEDEAFGEDPPPLFTGEKELDGPTGKPDKQERLIIRQTDPLPIHIKRIIADVEYTR